MASSARTSTNALSITNVRVFTGTSISPPTTVHISGSLIVDSVPPGTLSLDARGATLLPGLIDAHVHLTGPAHLSALARAGVTTALDMAAWPPSLVDSLRNRPGVTDIRSAGTPLTSPGSMHSRIPHLPQEALISSTEDIWTFVDARLKEGSDYIKVIADVPGPSQAVLNVAVKAAHDRGAKVVAHAAGYEPVRMAQEAKVDVLTHTPIDRAVGKDEAELMAWESRVCVPTLVMMQGVAALGRPGTSYSCASESVAAMRAAGVKVLAGTDANDQPGSPFQVRHGSSLHDELRLLAEAGMSNVEALRAATVETAEVFDLTDRGIVEAGKRADLILVDGDPIEDLEATRRVLRVWCAGVEVQL